VGFRFAVFRVSRSQGPGLDLDLTGFNSDELDELLHRGESGGGLTDEDAAPEIPEVAVSQAGDVWSLGNHRLLCGDATGRQQLRAIDGRRTGGHGVHRSAYNVDYGQKKKGQGKRQIAK
jgi:hypothetical protein